MPIDIELMNWYWHWKRFILIDELILILIKALLIVCQLILTLMNWYWHWKRVIQIDKLILTLIKALLIVCRLILRANDWSNYLPMFAFPTLGCIYPKRKKRYICKFICPLLVSACLSQNLTHFALHASCTKDPLGSLVSKELDTVCMELGRGALILCALVL